MTDDKPLLAVIHADKRLHAILDIERTVENKKPGAIGKLLSNFVRPAIEITLNVHRKGGATSGQIDELDRLALEAAKV